MDSTCTINEDLIYIPVTVDENNFFQDGKRVIKVLRPHWDQNNINYKMFTDGITNKLVAFFVDKWPENPEDIVLIRIYGHKTDMLIDRTAELRNIKHLNTVGLAPKIYGRFENGFAYEFLVGVTLTPETVISPKVWPLVASRMAQMHKVELPAQIPREPMVWEKTEQFLALLPEPFTGEGKQGRFVSAFGSVTRLRVEYERLKAHLARVGGRLVFAHNDLLLGNVIYNASADAGAGSVMLIDYEYAAYNYRGFDIANHFNEFVGLTEIDYSKFPSREFQAQWLRVYLEEFEGGASIADEEVEQLLEEVRQFVLASHFLWAVWALVQFEHSYIDFDYCEYASIRLNEYYRLKDSTIKSWSINSRL